MIDISSEIRSRLDELNLTIYGAAQLLAAETDDPVKSCHQRISRLIEREPESVKQLKEIVEVLGGRIQIDWTQP